MQKTQIALFFFSLSGSPVALPAPEALKIISEKDHVFLLWKSLAVKEKGFNESRVRSPKLPPGAKCIDSINHWSVALLFIFGTRADSQQMHALTMLYEAWAGSVLQMAHHLCLVVLCPEF